MTYRVVLTDRARRDRDDAFDWYAENYSPEFAFRWYRGISRAICGLKRSPERYGLAHESDKFAFELRELLYGGRRYKHRVLFVIEGNIASVLHIRHSSQRDLTEADL